MIHFESPLCNLNCVFCEVDGGMKLPTVAERLEKIKRFKADGISMIRFSGGEPTMHPGLLELIRFSGEQGFRLIELETNGVALSDASFAKQLHQAGLNSVFMNTPSHRRDIYERITQTPGSFEKFEAALEIIGSLKIPFGANLALTRINFSFEHFRSLFDFLKAKGVALRSFSFRVFRVNEKIASMSEVYMPRYEEVAGEIMKMVKFCRDAGIGVRDGGSFSLPLCVCEGIEEYYVSREKKSRSYVERVFFKPEACGPCAAKDLCVGVSRSYPYKFEPRPFKEIPKRLRSIYI